MKEMNKQHLLTSYINKKRKKKTPYFPAHKTHRDFFVRNFIKKKKWWWMYF